ncbi:MAG TPA: hydrogenase maturation protease [Streptosporangiaceae bacterium]|jgi:hydrogenase maturation protease
MSGRLLIAGIGNIFLGDDGFGVEVAGRLAALDLPDWVTVGDYGISGMHLAYDLANGVHTAILVDAMPRGDEPGTVYVVEPDRQAAGVADGAAKAGPAVTAAAPAIFDGHGMQPDVVLAMLDTLGASVEKVLIVGCEPASIDYGIGLSEPVTAAVDRAVQTVLDLIDKYGQEGV